MRPDGAGRLRKVGPGPQGPGGNRLHVPDGAGGFVPQADPRLVAAQMQAALLAKRCLALVMEATRHACGERPPRSTHHEVGMVADPSNLTGVVVRDWQGSFFRVAQVRLVLEALDGDPFAGRQGPQSQEQEGPEGGPLPEPDVDAG